MANFVRIIIITNEDKIALIGHPEAVVLYYTLPHGEILKNETPEKAASRVALEFAASRIDMPRPAFTDIDTDTDALTYYFVAREIERARPAGYEWVAPPKDDTRFQVTEFNRKQLPDVAFVPNIWKNRIIEIFDKNLKKSPKS
ncbi:MAG: hypothetical protein FWG18_01365 [Alphaproteobacteria bacterium]|nr:hypothetical protein [Alphaproteobacteria bacterium]